MQTHKTLATVQEGGKLVVENVPFAAGEQVEVVIAVPEPKNERPKLRRLQGTPYRYDDPFEPAVPPEDWDALK
jgi:hypothetical protein